MFATLLAVTLAAPSAPTIVERHAATRLVEAHRALQSDQRTARTAASQLYHYATHHLALEAEMARSMAAAIVRAVDASAGRLEAVRQGLTPAQRKDMSTDLQRITDWHGKAVAAVNGLKTEVARPEPDGREIRFHTSAIYEALAGAGEAHEQLMQRLNITLAERSTARTR